MKKILKALICGFITCGLLACSQGTHESETVESKKDSIVFEETTLVDDDNTSFTINSISDSGDLSLKVSMKNKSNLNLMYSIDDVSINGLVEDPFWAKEVTAGNKANSSIDFYSHVLKEDGIDEVTKITFTLNIYDNDDWMADRLVQEEFTIYPYGDDKAKEYVREAKDTDIVFVDNENVKIVLDSVYEDEYEYTLKFYLENKTDKNLMYSINDAVVNGYMEDPFWACALGKNCKGYAKVCWYKSSLEEDGIDKIETIEMPFSVADNDHWELPYILEQTFTYQAK